MPLNTAPQLRRFFLPCCSTMRADIELWLVSPASLLAGFVDAIVWVAAACGDAFVH